MKLMIYILLLGTAGCATTSVWNSTGKAEIQIDRIDCRAFNPEIEENHAIVYGRKIVPVVAGLINQTREGVVDSLLVHGTEGKLFVDASSMYAVGGQKIDIVPANNLQVGSFSKSPTSVVLHQPGGMLLSDNDTRSGARWRNRVAIPTVIESAPDGQELWTVKVLDKPWIAYGKRSYVVYECGAITVVNRLVFVPFAVAIDVVTLPFQIILGLFVHI